MELKSNKKRYSYLDLLKCIAMYGVVFYHGAIPWLPVLTDTPMSYVNYFIMAILSMSVPVFFFVNGFLMFGKNFDMKRHIKKTVHILCVAVIWGVLTTVFLMIIRGEYLGIRGLFQTLWQLKANWISHLWFLGILVCIYLIFPLLNVVYESNRKIFIYFVAIGSIMIFGNSLLNEMATLCTVIIQHPKMIENLNFFHIFNPFKDTYSFAFIYFCLGGLVYGYKDKIAVWAENKGTKIAVYSLIMNLCCLFAIGLMYSNFTDRPWDTVWNGQTTIFTLCSVMSVFVVAVRYKEKNAVIQKISQNTLGIYLIHVIVVRFMERILPVPLMTHLGVSVLYIAVIMILSLGITEIIHRIPIVHRIL